MKITFLVDLLCLVIFGLEAIIKTKRRGLLVEGGYLRSRSQYHLPLYVEEKISCIGRVA